jgi:hypothetical protein
MAWPTHDASDNDVEYARPYRDTVIACTLKRTQRGFRLPVPSFESFEGDKMFYTARKFRHCLWRVKATIAF